MGWNEDDDDEADDVSRNLARGTGPQGVVATDSLAHERVG